MSARLLAVVYLIASLCAVIWLWHFWTPRCNEACARWVVLSMYGTFLFVPAAALSIAALTLWGKVRRYASIGIFGMIAVVLLLWIAFVTRGTTIQ